MKKLLKGATALTAAALLTSLVGCGKSKAGLDMTIETLWSLGKVRANPLTKEGSWPTSTYELASHADVKPPVAAPPAAPVPSGRPQPPSGPVHPATPVQPTPPEIGNTIQILGNICEISRTELQPGKPIPPDFSLTIGGEACPIEYGVSTQARVSGDISQAHFRARSASAREFADVDVMDMMLEFGQGDQPNAAILRMTITGNSQKNGLLEMKLEGPLQMVDEKNTTGTISGHLVIGEHEAEIKQVIRITNDQEYDEIYVNEQRLTDDQVRLVLGALPHVEKKPGWK